MFRFCFFVLFCTVGFLFSGGNVLSQGCSDAGVCSVNAFHAGGDGFETDSLSSYSLHTGLSYGVGDFSVNYLVANIDFVAKLNNHWAVSGKITMQRASGDLGNVIGLSDFFATVSYSGFSDIQIVGGIKAPLSSANSEIDGKALPMEYQSSVGSIDLLAGLRTDIGNFSAMIMFQQPLTSNSNTFLPELYAENSPAQQHSPTTGFYRKGDLLCRLSQTIPIHNRISFIPSLLPIYHLANDTYRNPTTRQDIELEQSAGLTFNVNAVFEYQFAGRSTMDFSVGFPLVVRKLRPDGLTRSFVAGISYQFLL